MNFTSRFLKGNWLKKATLYVSHPERLKNILPFLQKYVSKKGLLKVKDDLLCMKNYLLDISRGRYKDYNGKKLLLVVGVVIYVITPVDLLPDMIPTGLIDDVSIVLWGLKQVTDELKNYRIWKEGTPEDAPPTE